MEGGQRSYPFLGEQHTVEGVCEILDLYSLDDIQELMKQKAFGRELNQALAPYLKRRLKAGITGPDHAHPAEDPPR